LTIMEGRDVDMLLGLDMLKAHQACIDLQKHCLRIQGQEIPFLSDHELPAKARGDFGQLEGAHPPPGTDLTAGPSAPLQSLTPGRDRPPQNPANTSSNRTGFSEESILTIMGLGASREQAIEALRNVNGNVDLAASLLFEF